MVKVKVFVKTKYNSFVDVILKHVIFKYFLEITTQGLAECLQKCRDRVCWRQWRVVIH